MNVELKSEENFKGRSCHSNIYSYIRYLEEKIKEEIGNLDLYEKDLDEMDKLKRGFYKLVYPNKETNIIEYAKEFRNLLINGKETIEYAAIDLRNKCNLPPRDIYCLDMFYTNFYIKFIIINKKIPEIFKSYITNNVGFFERVLIRIKCIKYGIKPKTIEKIIERYYNIKQNKIYLELTYVCLKYLFSNTQNVSKLKGRPSLPIELKDIFKWYVNQRNINRVKMYKDKANIFSEEDIVIISKLINTSDELDKNYKEELSKKLHTFLR
jgi:hypothetical protein